MDLRPPAGASYAEGAALLTTYLTAWIPLTRQVRIHPTSNLLITAAAGGVGTAAIQVGLFAGATVTAAAGSPEKLALARELGAQRTVTYEEIADLDDIDIALDPVGGPVFTRLPEVAAAARRRDRDRLRGRRLGPVDPARLVGRNIGVQGFYLGRLLGFRPELVRGEVDELLALWRRGAIKPVIGAELPLERAAEAHDLIASRRSTGKVVLFLRPRSSRARPVGSAGRSWRRSRPVARRCRGSTWSTASTSRIRSLDRRRGGRPRLPERGRPGEGRRDGRRLPAHPRCQRRRRRLRRAGADPRMREGSAFVVTASLAGLVPMESDPLYVLTKHAVVGYARSMAPLLAPRGSGSTSSARGSCGRR